MTTDPIEEYLRDMTRTFEGCVLWAAKAILETDIRMTEGFQVLRSLPEGPSLFCMLPTANPEFHSLLTLGVDEKDLEALFLEEADTQLRRDALGEMANVISGLFVAEESLVARFGNLRPSSPFYCEGPYSSQADWSMRGSFEAHGKVVVVDFSIRRLGAERLT